MNIPDLLAPLRALHEKIRDAVVASCEASDVDALARVALDEEGDTIYAVDRVSEELLVEFLEREIAPHLPLVLIAEGIAGGKIVLPRGTAEERAAVRIIVDPIDGTRGIMYQKRPAWILTGVAPNKGAATSLRDIELALMTEVPLVKQHLSDTLWAERGKGVVGERYNRISGARSAFAPRPSQAPGIEHGYASLVRFFPGAKVEISQLDEELASAVMGPPRLGKAQSFEDQYISTGGQLYELIAGRDRFTADLRPLMEKLLEQRGVQLGICCHPYDLCTELIAREAGVIVTRPDGELPDALLNVEANVAWVAYANLKLRALIEPHLKEGLRRRGLL